MSIGRWAPIPCRQTIMRKLLIIVLLVATGQLFFADWAPRQVIAKEVEKPVTTPVARPMLQESSEPPSITKPPEPRVYPDIGSATSESVTTAIRFFQDKGLTNVGVAYLVGNFISESGLRPNATGDNGLALGIAQWHPERRVGLPESLEGQLEFAWREIQAYPLKSAVYGTDEGFLMSAIRRYEGYSVEGNRFGYAKQLMKELE